MRIRAKLAGRISQIEEPENYQLNRFLYANKTKRIELEEFYSLVVDTSYIDLTWQETKTDLTYFFYPGVGLKDSTYITFAAVNISVRFFSFPKPDTTHVGFSKLSVELANLNKFLVFPDAPITDFIEEVYPNIEVRRVKLSALSSSTENVELWQTKEKITEKVELWDNIKPTKKIELWENANITDKYQTEINIPKTKEYISTFIPKIEKLSLLNPKELLTDSYIVNNKQIAADVNLTAPQINLYSDLQVSNDYPMMYYHNFEMPLAKTNFPTDDEVDFKLPDTNTVLEPDEEFDIDNIFTENEESTENLLEEQEFNVLHKFLEPVFELSEDEIDEILYALPDYQKEGARFLFQSSQALFYDSFELGKEVQVIMAIKLLLKIRVVRKILLITHDYRECTMITNGSKLYDSLWQSNLNSLLSGYTYKFYPDNFYLSTEQHLENYTFHGMTYEVYKNCLNNDPGFKKKLEMFDCIIVDDLSEEIIKKDYVKSLFKTVSPDYFWLLSDHNSEKFLNKIAKLLPNKNLNLLGRNKKSVEQPLSKRYNFDFFVELDEVNKDLSGEIFEKGQKKLDDIVQFGSILRLQPNAMHFIQDSQRRSNFIEGTTKGNKSELLKYHISKILDNTDRLLIYSQFEQMGISQIAEILSEMKIEYIIFRQLDSSHEINEKLNIGRTNEDKLVYLTNINPNGIKFKFPKVSYLINFDNWWNPLIRWTLESKLEKDENEGLTIFNYYHNDALETKLIYEQLLLGLNEKNILEVLPREKYNQICDDKFWGTFFDLPYEIFKNVKEENKIDSPEVLVQDADKLLNFLGYKTTGSDGGINDNTFTLTGQTVVNDEIYNVSAVCIFGKEISSEITNVLIQRYGKEGTKVFIITNGTISKRDLVLNESVSLIDGAQLKSYLRLFGI